MLFWMSYGSVNFRIVVLQVDFRLFILFHQREISIFFYLIKVDFEEYLSFLSVIYFCQKPHIRF